MEQAVTTLTAPSKAPPSIANKGSTPHRIPPPVRPSPMEQASDQVRLRREREAMRTAPPRPHAFHAEAIAIKGSTPSQSTTPCLKKCDEASSTMVTAAPKPPRSALKPSLIKDGNGSQVRPFADLKKHQDDAMFMVKIEEKAQVPGSLQLSSLTLGSCTVEEELRMQKRLQRMAAVWQDPAGKTCFEMRRRQLEMKYRNDCQAFGVVTSKLLQKNHDLEDFLKQALLESLEDLERTLLNEVDFLLSRMSGWGAYITYLHANSSAIKRSAIVSYPTGEVWARSLQPPFAASDSEFSNLAKSFDDVEKVPQVGADLEGIHYIVVRTEETLIFGKKDKSGFFAAKTAKAVLIAVYEGDGHQTSMEVRKAVEHLAEHIKKSGL